jgi:dTDP-4-amino-4,6-dideoxygalactose transaminase
VNHLENSGMLNGFTQYFDEKKIDMPSDYQIQMSGVEAKVGIVQIEKYHDVIQTRRKYSAYYSSALKNIEGINIVKAVEGANYSHIIVLSKNREILLKKALERGLQLGSIIDYCIPNMPAYKKYTPPDEEYPIANYYSEHIINLPVSGEFNIEAAYDVVEILRQICFEAENREGKYSIQD